MSVAATTAHASATPRALPAPPPPVHVRAGLAAAYAEHPLVAEVRSAGTWTLLAREQVLSENLPLDRALAVVDAIQTDSFAQNAIADGLVRALRARHSVGPSGAALGKPIDYRTLTGREALVLGWVRARALAASVKDLQRPGEHIRDASAPQLLEHAVAQAPGHQAPRLALALLRATLAPAKGKAACRAWEQVQQAARDGGQAAVPVSMAEAAVAAVAPLGRACSAARQRELATAIQLPPPLAEAGPAPRGPAERRQSVVGANTMKEGLAWAVLAPVFKGWLADADVARIARGARLDQVTLESILARDPTGDVAVAAINGSTLMRRIALDDQSAVVWGAVIRRRGLLDAGVERERALRVAQLTGPEAMAWAYAKALEGRDAGSAVEVAAETLAWTASPATLFAWARLRTPSNAALGPIMGHAHLLDLDRRSDRCAAARRAESIGFIVEKSSLPPAAKAALAPLANAAAADCAATQGPPAPAAPRKAP